MTESNNTAGFVGIGFWILVFLAFVFWTVWGPGGADLQVSVAGSNTAESGTADITVVVHVDGTEMSAGSVNITAEEVRTRQHWSSQQLTLSDGRFVGEIPDRREDGTLVPLKLVADYVGVRVDGEDSDEISATRTVYLNTPIPPSTAVVSSISLACAVVALTLIIIFTGTLSRRKARTLFAVMYFITFLSIVAPLVIVMVVPFSPYMTDLMERSPIGVVSAVGDGIDQEQWLLNIGGLVAPADTDTTTQTIAPEPPADPTGALETAAQATTLAGGNVPTPVAPPPEVGAADLDIPLQVRGGLAIPLYVILLSMFGAAINMTRSIPEIQKDSVMRHLPGDGESLFRTFLDAPGTMFGQRLSYKDDNAALGAAVIREQSIKNFMYLLSAPFLAVAVYYLLQLAAESLATPVLVIMAFATGLVSEQIVGTIIRTARNRFSEISPERDEAALAAEAARAIQDAELAEAAEAIKAAETAQAPLARPEPEPEPTGVRTGQARNAGTDGQTEAPPDAADAQATPASSETPQSDPSVEEAPSGNGRGAGPAL